MGKKALITGVGGMDGSHLSDYLLDMPEYTDIYGLVRRSSADNLFRIRHLLNNSKFHLVYGDVTDPCSINKIVSESLPDEVYHLSAQSHVGLSFDTANYTFNSIVSGTKNVLDALTNICPTAKFYHASSSEQFGDTTGYDFQNEQTPFKPLSPYAIAKTCAHELTHYYRRTKGLQTYTGILFNHEGPRRGEQFVTRKITMYLGQLSHISNLDFANKLCLGDITPRRDWGYAPDYVRAMHLLLQQNKIDNIVIATGETHTIEEFLEKAFGCLDLNWQQYTVINSSNFVRPNEVKHLCGDASLAKEVLGWEPAITFNELVEIMVNSDVEAASTKT